MKRAAIIALVVACAGLGACSRDLEPPVPPPEPTTITLQFQNGGAAPAYVYQGCLVDLTITSLADPAAVINRVEGCVCECGRTTACPICGACYAGPREIPAAGQMTESWLTATVTSESTPTGGCQRLHTLPAGTYRIALPVYASEADAAAKTSARIVTQTFTLPEPDDTVAIPVAAAP
jgi:hypothetical protein